MEQRDPRDDERKSNPRSGQRSASSGNQSRGASKPYVARDGERKPYPKRDGDKPHAKREGDRKPYPKRDGDTRPHEKRDGDRKPYPKRDGGSRPYEKRDGGSRPYEKRDGDRKSYPNRDGASRPYEKRDGDRKPYPNRDGASRPYEKRDGDRKPYPNREGASRPYEKRDGDRKPYEKRDGDRKPYPSRDGGSRPYEKRDGDRKPYPNREGASRPYEKRDGDRKPYEKRDGGSRPYEKRDGDRKSYEKRDGAPYGARGGSSRPDRPTRGGAGRPDRATRPEEIRSIRPRHDDPVIPDEVTERDLNQAARNELKTLSKENADGVARHLAMAAQLIDEDPELAHQHALSASRRAGRIAVVRETLAITAYATGDYALAIRELRTYRRISGREDQIALMVDSERGVGRPDRALEVGRAVDRSILPVPVRVELAIAMSGARLDLGEPERALAELDIPEFAPDRAFEWSPALFSARAAVLEELGREAEAAEWQHRADVAAQALYDASGEADLEVIIVEEVLEEGGDEPDPADDERDEDAVDDEAVSDSDSEDEHSDDLDSEDASFDDVENAADDADVSDSDSEDEHSGDVEDETGATDEGDQPIAADEPLPEATIEDEVREILIEAGVDEPEDER